MTNGDKERLAKRFLSVLGKPDAQLVKSVAVDDLIWTFPGSSVISGEARGVAAIMNRAKAISEHEVRVETVRTVYGHDGVAVILHNTGSQNGRLLDEHLAAVF